jgi:hypothetical protein
MTEESPGMSARDKAEIILQMTKEAKRIERRTGAEACIVICIFGTKDANGSVTLTFQDAGRFPMPPDHFYGVMQQAHKKGLLDKDNPKIIKPH